MGGRVAAGGHGDLGGDGIIVGLMRTGHCDHDRDRKLARVVRVAGDELGESPTWVGVTFLSDCPSPKSTFAFHFDPGEPEGSLITKLASMVARDRSTGCNRDRGAPRA